MTVLLLQNRNGGFRKSLLLRVVLVSMLPAIFFLHRVNQLRTPLFLQMPHTIQSSAKNSILQPGVIVPAPHGNLVAQHERVIRGPWVIDPPLPPQIPTGKPFTINFRCLWNVDDLCPERYIVVLRGPTIYAPPIPAISQNKTDRTRVSVTINVPEPGVYQLYAWADFGDCRKYWRQHMKYPFNRGQVIDTPAKLEVSGSANITDSTDRCLMDGPENKGHAHGRWLYRGALWPEQQVSSWAKSYPEDQDYIYQPYSCKRHHLDAHVLYDTKNVDHVLFLGDSVTRGSFCTQIWQKLAPSGKADGPCTYSDNTKTYHVSPKDMWYPTSNGRNVRLSFRFMNHEPVKQIKEVAKQIAHRPPTHIVFNIGLWLSARPINEYTDTITEFMLYLWKTYPKATIIWRTTTDVVPMIECYSEKLMYRTTMHLQNEASINVVEKLRSEGMGIYVVDAYHMTLTRPDTGNDGRHWVMEKPQLFEATKKARPAVAQAELAVLGNIWDIIVQDDNAREEKARKAAIGSES